MKLGGHPVYGNKKVAEKTPGPPLARITNHFLFKTTSGIIQVG